MSRTNFANYYPFNTVQNQALYLNRLFKITIVGNVASRTVLVLRKKKILKTKRLHYINGFIITVTALLPASTATPRALSLRNLVLGYECRRVFRAGVGPDSPSRDATNWLSSRFGRSVQTRRRYGWLRMVFTRCVSSELQFRALGEVVARKRQGTLSRKVWSTG